MKYAQETQEALEALIAQGFVFDDEDDTCCHCSFSCTD